MTISEACLLKKTLEDIISEGSQFEQHKILRNSDLVTNLSKSEGDLSEAIVSYIECNMYQMAIVCLSDYIKIEEKKQQEFLLNLKKDK